MNGSEVIEQGEEACEVIPIEPDRLRETHALPAEPVERGEKVECLRKWSCGFIAARFSGLAEKIGDVVHSVLL